MESGRVGRYPAAVTYAEAIAFLRSLQVFGVRPGLETTLELARRIGCPQDRLRFIHVAGTNGKGSVCAFLEAMHRHAGRRVGLYTSPHLVSFGERIQVDRAPIPEADVARWTERIRTELTQPLPDGRMPTFFEFVTVMALGYFAEQSCDLVVWETGLGGRLDATNIVMPEASVITNIDLDHQQWLGATHEAIAAEKAGIIKPGRPVVTGAAPGRGAEVIAARARELGCALTLIGDGSVISGVATVDEAAAWSWATDGHGGNWPGLGLAGRHQRANAAVALATARVLNPSWPVFLQAMRAALETTHWPGRMQICPRPGGGQWILDGAHNVAGAEVLRQGLEDLWPELRPVLVVGLLADKDWEAMVQVLAPLAARILTVPVKSSRTLSADLLASTCARVALGPVEACTDLSDALARVRNSSHVVVAGSLYLVGEALELLDLAPGELPSERDLNEWKAGR